MENDTRKRFRKGRGVVAASVLAFALVVGSIGVLAVNNWFGTALTINDAFENFGEEFAQRIETTPLVSFVRIGEAMNEGVITADVNISQQGFFGINGDINARLYSSAEQERMALLLNAEVMGINADASLFLNADSIAIGSDVFLGENNLGVFFDTVETDAQNFFNLASLTQRDRADAIYAIEVIGEFAREFFANLNGGEEHNFQPYITLLNNFINSIEQDRLNTSINGVSVERIALEINNESLVGFLNDLYSVMAEDNYLHLLLNVNESAFDWLLQGLLWAIEDLEESEEELLINIYFYIGNGNRLVRFQLDTSIGYDSASIILDTGAHALDTWTLEINSTYFVLKELREDSMVIEWTLENVGGTYSNTITITNNVWHWNEPDVFILSSVWTPSTGGFTLGFEEVGWDSGSFDGNFLLTDDSMTLRFEDINIDGIEIAITIGAEVGVQTPSADFVNISDWDQDLIDHIEQQIAAFEFMMMLLGTAW